MIDSSKNKVPTEEYPSRIYKLRRNIENFGTEEEYVLFEEFGELFFVKKDIPKANEKLKELKLLFTNNIRKELGLKERILKVYK